MKLQTDYCKQYFARNPKILERLNEVERMLNSEFNIECAGSQYDTQYYTDTPVKFSWWLRFGSAEMPIGLLNHYIDYPSNNGINFSFFTWIENQDDQVLSLCEPLRERLGTISDRVDDEEKTADDLAREEACRADNEAWQNGQAKLIEQILETRNRSSIVIQKAEKVEQKTTEQLQADEFNKFSKLAQNSKGVEFTINLTSDSLAYRLSVKLQNPRTGNKITIYQFRNDSTVGLTTVYNSEKFNQPLRQYTPKNKAEMQHIFNACIEKLATRDRV